MAKGQSTAQTDAPTQSASTEIALNEFRAELLSGRFVVRGFSDDPVSYFQWTGNSLSMTPPRLHTLGVYSFRSIDLHGANVEIQGDRYTLVKDKDDKPKLVGLTPVVLQIALGDADPARVLPVLKSHLVFPTVEAALLLLPPEYTSMLPGGEKLKPPPKPDCASSAAHFEFPEIQTGLDPKALERSQRSASVIVLLTVDEQGHPANVWVLKPAEPRLDRSAAERAAAFVFKPATCDGVPVRSTFSINMHFGPRPAQSER